MKVGVILDDFSYYNFSPEFQAIKISSKNFMNDIKNIDMLFVESAWAGNNNQWRLVIGPNNRWVDGAINSIINVCKKRGIPTVFWNKEDPVHFKNFLWLAKKFDFVFTTDDGSINKYRSALKHNRIYALPFAAQPMYQYPSVLSGRNKNPCFAGTYWNKQHLHRKKQMECVLKPCIPYGLHIYDRKKVGGAGNSFPGPYDKCVVGGVPFLELMNKYRNYRFFVNVNIVTNSNTMFSRRVFEIASCGTPILSYPSLGMKRVFGDSIVFSDSEEKSREYIRNILSNDAYWEELSIKGIKVVYGKNTYSHRFDRICRIVGVRTPDVVTRRIELYDRVMKCNSVSEASLLMREIL